MDFNEDNSLSSSSKFNAAVQIIRPRQNLLTSHSKQETSSSPSPSRVKVTKLVLKTSPVKVSKSSVYPKNIPRSPVSYTRSILTDLKDHKSTSDQKTSSLSEAEKYQQQKNDLAKITSELSDYLSESMKKEEEKYEKRLSLAEEIAISEQINKTRVISTGPDSDSNSPGSATGIKATNDNSVINSDKTFPINQEILDESPRKTIMEARLQNEEALRVLGESSQISDELDRESGNPSKNLEILQEKSGKPEPLPRKIVKEAEETRKPEKIQDSVGFKKHLDSSKKDSIVKKDPESSKKEKPYDPEAARDFMRKQREKRKNEEKPTGTAEKDLIKQRLEELKKNTRKIVSNNLNKARSRSTSNTPKKIQPLKKSDTLPSMKPPKIITRREKTQENLKKTDKFDRKVNGQEIERKIMEAKEVSLEARTPGKFEGKKALNQERGAGKKLEAEKLVEKKEEAGKTGSVLKNNEFKRNIKETVNQKRPEVQEDPRLNGKQKEEEILNQLLYGDSKKIGILRKPEDKSGPSMFEDQIDSLIKSVLEAKNPSPVKKKPAEKKQEQEVLAKSPDPRNSPKYNVSKSINDSKRGHKPNIPYWLRNSAVRPYPYNFIWAVRKKLEALTQDTQRREVSVVQKSQESKNWKKSVEIQETPRTHLRKPMLDQLDVKKNRFSDFLMHKYMSETPKIDLKKPVPGNDSETNANTSSFQDPDGNTISEISSLKSDAVNPISSTRIEPDHDGEETLKEEDEDTTIDESLRSPQKSEFKGKLVEEQEDQLFVTLHRGSLDRNGENLGKIGDHKIGADFSMNNTEKRRNFLGTAKVSWDDIQMKSVSNNLRDLEDDSRKNQESSWKNQEKNLADSKTHPESSRKPFSVENRNLNLSKITERSTSVPDSYGNSSDFEEPDGESSEVRESSNFQESHERSSNIQDSFQDNDRNTSKTDESSRNTSDDFAKPRSFLETNGRFSTYQESSGNGPGSNGRSSNIQEYSSRSFKNQETSERSSKNQEATQKSLENERNSMENPFSLRNLQDASTYLSSFQNVDQGFQRKPLNNQVPAKLNNGKNLATISEIQDEDKENQDKNMVPDKEVEYQRMLDAFNKSLSHVIEVNQMLYTALSEKSYSTKKSSSSSQFQQSFSSTRSISTLKNDLSAGKPNPAASEYSNTFESVGTEEIVTASNISEALDETEQKSLSDSELEETRKQNSVVTAKKNQEVEEKSADSNSIRTLILENEEVDNEKSFVVKYSENSGIMKNFHENNLSLLKDQPNNSSFQGKGLSTATITTKTTTRTTKIHHQNIVNEDLDANLTTEESDVLAVFNCTDTEISFNATVMTDLNCSYSSIGMLDQMLKTEANKSDMLTMKIQLREKALIDRTKGQIAWLELQKQKYRKKGMVEKITEIKKKQRAILVRLEKERSNIKRMTDGQQQIVGSNRSLNDKFDTSLNLKKSLTPKKVDKSIEPVRGYDMQAGESIERILQKREEELQKRRQHVEYLMKWHQKLDQEEQEIIDMEKLLLGSNLRKISDKENVVVDEIDNLNLIKRRRSITSGKESEGRKSLDSSQSAVQQHKKLKKIEKSLKLLQNISSTTINTEDETDENVDVSGSNLNKLWIRLTGQQLEKYDPNKIYNLTKKDLSQLYEEAKISVLESFSEAQNVKKLFASPPRPESTGSSKKIHQSEKDKVDSPEKPLEVPSEVSTMNSIENIVTEEESPPHSDDVLDSEVFNTQIKVFMKPQEPKSPEKDATMDLSARRSLSFNDSDLETLKSSKSTPKDGDVKDLFKIYDVSEIYKQNDLSGEDVLGNSKDASQDFQGKTFVVEKSMEKSEDSSSGRKLELSEIAEEPEVAGIESEAGKSEVEPEKLKIKEICAEKLEVQEIGAGEPETGSISTDISFNSESIQEIEEDLKIADKIDRLEDISFPHFESTINDTNLGIEEEEEAGEKSVSEEVSVSHDYDESSGSEKRNSELEKRLASINDSLEELNDIFERVPIIHSKSASQSPDFSSGSSTLTYSTDRDFKDKIGSNNFRENLGKTKKLEEKSPKTAEKSSESKEDSESSGKTLEGLEKSEQSEETFEKSEKSTEKSPESSENSKKSPESDKTFEKSPKSEEEPSRSQKSLEDPSKSLEETSKSHKSSEESSKSWKSAEETGKSPENSSKSQKSSISEHLDVPTSSESENSEMRSQETSESQKEFIRFINSSISKAEGNGSKIPGGVTMPDIISEAEVLRRQQLVIEQEIKELESQVPYIFKLPPPYPEQPSIDSPVSLVIPSDSKISSIVEDKLDQLYSGASKRSESSNIYERIILNMCQEYFEEFKEPEVKPPSYMKESSYKNLIFYSSKDKKRCLQEYILKKVQKILIIPTKVNQQQLQQNSQLFPLGHLGLSGSQLRPFHFYLNSINYCNSRRKRDNVDEILISEMVEDENKWLYFDKEESEIKNNLTNEILDWLLEEAIEEMQEAYRKKHREETKELVDESQEVSARESEQVSVQESLESQVGEESSISEQIISGSEQFSSVSGPSQHI